MIFPVMVSLLIQQLQSELSEYHFLPASSKEEENIRELISRFGSFDIYTPAFLVEVIAFNHHNNRSFLCLVSLNFTFKASKTPQNELNITEQELVGFAILQKEYGRVLIRPETISDKIIELFDKTEIDFSNDLAFSSRYYVLADNESRCRLSISAEFLKTVRRFEDIEIEIDGRILIARFRKPFTVEIGVALTKFIADINNGNN